MFGSYLPPVVWRRAHVFFVLSYVFTFLALSLVLWCPLRFQHKYDICVQHILTIWITWRVSYKKQELLTLCEHLCSPLVFDGVRVAHSLGFCVVLFVLFVYVLYLVYPKLPVSMGCPFFYPFGFFSTVYLLYTLGTEDS